MEPKDGLEWARTTFGLRPRWTKDPQVSAIRTVVQGTFHCQNCEVEFFRQGAFNKLYIVRYGNESLVMRVSLPVDPGFKTESEVANLQFVQENNNLPVPTVRAYRSTDSNPVGFEWILMDFMPGAPLRERWRCMSWPA